MSASLFPPLGLCARLMKVRFLNVIGFLGLGADWHRV